MQIYRPQMLMVEACMQSHILQLCNMLSRQLSLSQNFSRHFHQMITHLYAALICNRFVLPNNSLATTILSLVKHSWSHYIIRLSSNILHWTAQNNVLFLYTLLQTSTIKLRRLVYAAKKYQHKVQINIRYTLIIYYNDSIVKYMLM